jgi:hypothetical protein
MVQCDTCSRWVHIACDGMAPTMQNLIANPGLVVHYCYVSVCMYVSTETKYHCPECVMRKKSNCMTVILDVLQRFVLFMVMIANRFVSFHPLSADKQEFFTWPVTEQIAPVRLVCMSFDLIQLFLSCLLAIFRDDQNTDGFHDNSAQTARAEVCPH